MITEKEIHDFETNNADFPTLINKSIPDLIINWLPKLTIDQMYSYKQLTEILQIPYCKGNQKNRQLVVLEQFINLEKNGSKYKIIEIYDKIHPNLSFSERSIYIKDMATVLMIHLFTTGKEINYLSYKELSSLFCFYNDNYMRYIKEPQKLAEKVDVFTADVHDFYTRSSTFNRDTINSALNSLRNRCIIDYYETTMIIKKNNKGDIIKNEATDQQRLELLAMKKSALDELGFENIKEFYNKPDLKKDYYNLLDKQCEKLHPSWIYVYNVLKIYAPMTILTQESEKLFSQYNINRMVQDFLQLQAEKKFDKWSNDGYSRHSNWIKNQNKVTNELIPI